MPFICPACAAPTLGISATLAVPGDDTWDEITLQVLACGRCGLRALAVYRESRRGALDSEAYWHDGYHVSPADVDRVAADLTLCPRSADEACACAVHRRLGAQRAGRWVDVAGIGVTVESQFRLEAVP